MISDEYNRHLCALTFFIVGLGYGVAGLIAWRELLRFEEQIGRCDLRLLAVTTLWGKIGRTLLVLTWPLWTVLPHYLHKASSR